MFELRLAIMIIITVTVVTAAAAAASGQASEAINQQRRLHLQNGRLSVDGKLVHQGFSITQAHFRFLYFYVPARGLYIVSDAPFEGAGESGSFHGSVLAFRLDSAEVRIESSSKILSGPTSSAWVKFDPSFKLDLQSVMLGYGDKESAPYDWPNQLRENR